MKKQANRYLAFLAAVLLLGCAAVWFLYRCDNKYAAALPGGEGYNVLPEDGDEVAFLVDGWEIYPGQLLEPSDWEAGAQPEQYTYIGQYPNFSALSGSPYGTATYRLTLEHAGQPRELTLYLPELLCAGRVYINGTLAGELGSLEPYRPCVMDAVYSIPAAQTVELVIQCANYTHYYSGMYYPPAVGTPGAVSRMLAARLLVYGVLCFSSLAIGLAYLAQWMGGKDRASRWMGVLSLAFSLRVCYPFLRALGLDAAHPLFALEDVGAGVVLLCAVLLAGELSGVSGQALHRRVVLPACAGMCAFCGIFPVVILPRAPFFINPYGLILFFWNGTIGLYLMALAFRTLRTDQPMGHFLLAADGLFGLSVAASAVMANRLEPIRGAWLTEYGGFALVLGFAALMARRGRLLYRENQHLTAHLQEEVASQTAQVQALLAERRQLLANLLHDLKNPLSALRGYAELVQNGSAAPDAETAAYLDALIQQVSTVKERFEVIHDFSRRERAAALWETIGLNGLLQQFYDRNRPDIELSGPDFLLELPARELVVRGERERLWIALENLCYNALSFTPEDGTITLSLSREEGWAVIAVRDTGCGIAPEDLPFLFDRGFTRRPDNSGDGLGLAIVRTIALEHGGTAEARSQPGDGSCFLLRLPLSDPTAL